MNRIAEFEFISAAQREKDFPMEIQALRLPRRGTIFLLRLILHSRPARAF